MQDAVGNFCIKARSKVSRIWPIDSPYGVSHPQTYIPCRNASNFLTGLISIGGCWLRDVR
jgi:hypothetical protein